VVFVFHLNPALSEVPVPELKKRVTDLTDTLKEQEKIELEKILKDFEKRKGSQVAVLIVPSTEEEAIEQFSIRVVDEWKIGRKKIDDGVLLLIAKNDRKLRIEVGRGLEGALTDALSKRIIEEIIKPEFKSQKFFEGVKKGAEAITKVIDGEELPAPTVSSYENRNKSGSDDLFWPILFLVGFVALIFVRMFFGLWKSAGIVFIVSFFVFVLFLYFGQFVNSLIYASIAAIGYLILFGLFDLIGSSGGGSSSSSGSSWSSSSGSSWSSSSSSSSFGGGGGSFGGGGASGSW